MVRKKEKNGLGINIKVLSPGNIEVVFNFKDKKIIRNVGQDLSVSESNLIEQIQQHSSLLLYYNTLLVLATTEERRSRDRYEQEKANLYVKLKEEGSQKGVKMTQKELECHLMIDKKLNMLYKKWRSIEEKVNMLKGCIMAFQHRKDMLIQLGSRIKKEMEATNEINL